MIKRPHQIVLFIVAGFLLSFAISDTVCDGSNPPHDIITPDTPATSITQTVGDCVKSFKIQATSISDRTQYLIFEIEFASTSTDPLFLPFLLGLETNDTASSTVRPILTLDSGKLSAGSFSDYNGILNKKSYHYLIVPPEKLSYTNTFVFSMFRAYTDVTEQYGSDFVYTVSARTSAQYPCPQDCSGKGTCDVDKQKCACDALYFDEDCSVMANELKLSQLSSKSIDANSWGYFFFNIGSFDSDLKISLYKQSGTMEYSFLINEKDDFTIPNSAVSVGKYQLEQELLEGYLLIQEDNIASRKNDVLLIGVYNDESSSAIANITLDSYDDASLIRTISIYLMIGIALALLIVWIGISAFKYKHHTQMESLIRAYQAEREEEKTLSKKDMNKYFPKEKFSALKASFCQTMCSVCLEDFEAETVCRQLYCEHIYHANCIEAWLAQHYNCPNCKKDITRAAIEEHLKEKAGKEEKSMLIQDKIVEKKDELASANQSVSDAHNIAGINPQRVHIKKQVRDEEESKENHDSAFGQPERNKNKPRNLSITTAINLESKHKESDLKLSAAHEEGKPRNLSRLEVSKESSGSSRAELNSRTQNLRRPKRPGQPGSLVQPNQDPEGEVNALKLDL